MHIKNIFFTSQSLSWPDLVWPYSKLWYRVVDSYRIHVGESIIGRVSLFDKPEKPMHFLISSHFVFLWDYSFSAYQQQRRTRSSDRDSIGLSDRTFGHRLFNFEKLGSQPPNWRNYSSIIFLVYEGCLMRWGCNLIKLYPWLLYNWPFPSICKGVILNIKKFSNNIIIYNLIIFKPYLQEPTPNSNLQYK